jgi:hypothetical protein
MMRISYGYRAFTPFLLPHRLFKAVIGFSKPTSALRSA